MTRRTSGVLAKKAVTAGLMSALFLSLPPVALAAGADPDPSDNIEIKTVGAGKAVTPPPAEAAPAAAPPAATQKGSPLKFSGASDPPGQAPAEAKAVAPPEVTDPVPLAQGPGSVGTPVSGKLPDPRHTRLPTTVATVQIRRPFKLFAREELIRNLSFRDTPVKEVIAELARRGGLNILIDHSVVGSITGDLRDVTLNEAMDNVLAAAGLQSRVLDNSTVIIGTMQAMTQLGLNRPIARAFKLSYAHPYDVANLLHTSIFNRGMIPDFTMSTRTVKANTERVTEATQAQIRTQTTQQSLGEGGAQKSLNSMETKTPQEQTVDNSELSRENNQSGRPDVNRILRGISRPQTHEGVGYNNAATDPGSEQIRQYQETPVDYTVEQNGGGAIVIPDVKNRQVIVVGTPDDIAVADEAIHFIDRRPKQVHIQASLVELTNQGLRQLGAQLSLQSNGLSGNILGIQGQPLIQSLPGMGSLARPGPVVTDLAQAGPNSNTSNFTTTASNGFSNTGTNGFTNSNTFTFPPPTTTISNATTSSGTSTNNNSFASTLATAMAQAFSRTQTYSLNPGSLQTQPIFGGSTTPTPTATSGFTGLLGNLFPILTTPVAGVTPLATAQSAFNFLTLSKSAGGRANIATLPSALGLNLNLLLQTNKAKLVANPSVIVSDNTEALIVIADEVLHKITSVATITSVTTNVELTKAGVFLDVMPRVTEDGFIVMRLRPQVSSPLTPPTTFGTPPNTTTVTLLSIRDVLSQEVRIKDGQTLVLGGLFREDEAAQLSKVPYLAEMPIMGAFFRTTLKGRARSELMLLITPKIVEEDPPPTVTESPAPKTM